MKLKMTALLMSCWLFVVLLFWADPRPEVQQDLKASQLCTLPILFFGLWLDFLIFRQKKK